jgi:hypothetical protein
MNKVYRRSFSALILTFFLGLQLVPFLSKSPAISEKFVKSLSRFSLFQPHELDAAGLSSASATLSNPRLSYQAGVSTTITSGNTVITIAASSNADNNTNHLFPNDNVTVGPNLGLKVSSVVDATTFILTSGLGTGVTNTDKVYATQSGTLTVNFYTGSAVPVGGSIQIAVPASAGSVSGSPNDGAPDTAALASNGFDLNFLTTANITCPDMFTVGTLTAGTGGPSNPHLITCNWSGAAPLASGANLTVVIGDGSRGIVNPAPAASHTQGVADGYTINAYTKSTANGGGSTIESIGTKVAPVEGVLVSVTIDETLNFTVAGISSANINSTCGLTPAGNLVTTTAMAVPFGSSVTSNTFYNGAQQLTVSTNAPGGYSVKLEENDQMGKEGKVCTGATAGESVNCIKDTTCDGGTCTEATSADWATATNNGLGYSLSNNSGTDASFLYNESARTFSTKQFPDQEVPETKQTIMTNASVVNGSSACILYRLSVSGTQPAGYYYNKVKYTASATF